MKKTKVCFLGTPDFAKTHLEYLLSDYEYEVVGIVTQPDRPSGRKMQMTPSPVKVLAEEAGIEVLCPENLKKQPDILEHIRSWKANIAVVVAFGQILDEEFLKSFEYGAVNIHGSILPRWRGAAPIQRSLEAGDNETGVSLQKIVKKLDAGDVIGVRKVIVQDDWDARDLYNVLAQLGVDLLKFDLKDYIHGSLIPEKQNEDCVTIAKKIDKAESEIDWNQPSINIRNKIRAFSMGPGTYTVANGQRLKIHSVNLVKEECELGLFSDFSIGSIVKISDSYPWVKTMDGVIELVGVQPESRSIISATDWVQKSNIKVGFKLGDNHASR